MTTATAAHQGYKEVSLTLKNSGQNTGGDRPLYLNVNTTFTPVHSALRADHRRMNPDH